MKRSCHKKKSLVILHVIIALSLVLSSCGMLPEDVQKELDAVVKQQEEYLKETAQVKAEQLQETAQAKGVQLQETAQAKAGEVLGDAGERLKGIPGEVIQSAKEWLGLAAPADVGKVTIAITTKSSRIEIEAAFKKAYQLAGGGKTIGTPDDLVRRQGSELLV